MILASGENIHRLSELNESYPIIGKAQIDLLSANFNTSFTDGGLGLGAEINAVSISAFWEFLRGGKNEN